MSGKDKLISVEHLKWNVGGIECGALTVGYLNWILDHEEPAVDAVPTEALRLFVNWAEECGFGYDNIPEQYERYKDRLEDMGYIEGLMHIAIWEAERKDDDSD